MKLYIELLIIGMLAIMVVVWFTWHKISGWRAIKNYKLENDKSKKGGAKPDGRTAVGEPEVTTEPASVVGNELVERRELLPDATPDIPRPIISSSRKNGSSSRIRRLLRRNKK